MADDRIDNYVNRTAFAEDTQFVLDQLNKVYARFKDLDGFKLAMDKSLGLVDFTKVATQASSAMSSLGEATKTLKDDSAKLVAQQKANESAQRRVDKAIVEGRVEKQKYNAELKKEIELQNASAGSIDQARALIKNLTAERNKLDITTESGIKRLKELNDEIDKNNAFIDENTDKLNRRKINIGNYTGAASVIVDALKEVQAEISRLQEKQQNLVNLSKTNPIGFKLAGGDDELRRTNSAIEELTTTAQIGFQTNQDYSSSVKGIEKSYQNMAVSGNQATEFLEKFKDKVVESKRKVEDLKEGINALKSNTRGLDLTVQTLSFTAAGLKTVVGAEALFGVQAKNVQQTLVELVAVQNVANGVREVGEQLTKDGTAANLIYAKAQKIVAVATDSSAKATTRLIAAGKLLAGVGLIALVGYLVYKYHQLNKTMSDTQRQSKLLADVNKELSKSASEEIAKLQILRKVAEDTNLPIRERKEAVDELQKLYPDYFKNLNDEIILQGKAASAYDATKLAILEAAKTRAIETKLAELSNKELDILYDQRILNDKKRANDLRKQKADARKATTKDEKEARGLEQFSAIAEGGDLVTSLDKINKDLEQIAKDRQFLLDQITTAATGGGGGEAEVKDKSKEIKDRLDKELQVSFNILRVELQQRIDFNKEVVDDETRSLEDRLYALRQYLLARQALINAQADLERNLGEKTTSELLLIEKERADGLLRLNREVAEQGNEILTKNLQIDLETRKKFEDKVKELADKRLQDIKDKADREKKIADELLEQKKEIAEHEKELYKGLYAELKQLAVEFATASLNRKIAENEDEKGLIDERRQKDIDFINATVADRQRAADQITIIDAKAAADKSRLDNKNRELEKKKAAIEKLVKGAEIIGETAKGIAALSIKAAQIRAIAAGYAAAGFLPQAAIANGLAASVLAQIPLVAAIGAIQVARLVIPKFATGKDADNNYEGLAIVGDGGKSELHLRDDGSMEVTPNKPTLTYVGKNDQIFPDASMALSMGLASMGRKHDNIQSNMGLLQAAHTIDYDRLDGSFSKVGKSIVKAIHNKKEVHVHGYTSKQKLMQWEHANKEYLKMNGLKGWD